MYGTSTIDVVYDFIEVIRIGSSAFQLAKVSTGFKADHVCAYREFTNVTDTGAGSKGTWKSAYTTSAMTDSALLTDVTVADQTLKLSGITSYSDLDGRILIVYQESNASAKLPTRIKVNNLAYVPLYNLDGTAVEQDIFENKRVPILISYSSADSCFYLVGGGSGGAGHKILKSNKTVMPKEKNLMITGVSVHDSNITDVPADKLTKIKITAPDSSDESIKNIRKMTQAQYDALTTKDANTVYYITDGNDPIDMSDYIPLTGTEPITSIDATGPKNGKPVTGMIQIGSDIGGISGLMGSNDSYRIIGRSTASNSGFLEISTADDGTEPIYIRQYRISDGASINDNLKDFLAGDMNSSNITLKRTLTLLNENGNTVLPGSITVSKDCEMRMTINSGHVVTSNNNSIEKFGIINLYSVENNVTNRLSSLILSEDGLVGATKGKFAYGNANESGIFKTDTVNKSVTFTPRAISQ